MTFKEACERCKVRGYIKRKGHFRIWSKNHTDSFEKRIAKSDQKEDDWEHHDPEGVETSVVG